MSKQHALLTPTQGKVGHAHQAVTDANGVGSLICIHRSEGAATPGSPADTYIWADTPYEYLADFVPYNLRIVDVIVLVSTAVGGATIQLFNDAYGGGEAKSEAFDAASTGTKRSSGTASYSLNEDDQLVVRRSDGAVVFEIFIIFMKI